jgi:hypothetical protein
MQNSPPFFLNLSVPPCRLFSNTIAALHYCIVRAGLLRIPLCIYHAPGGMYKNLCKIWFSRVFRRTVSVLIRTPFRSKVLQLVDITFPVTDEGCVITMCHTPWSRLLTQWCLKNDFAMIITGNKWNQRTSKIRRNGKGFIELRQIIHHLRSGGKIIVMADLFNNLKNCSSVFLDCHCNVSLLPVRIAKIAKVPVIAAVPELCGNSIKASYGPRFDFRNSTTELSSVMQTFLYFFETEIRRNPSIWSVFVRGSLSKYNLQ